MAEVEDILRRVQALLAKAESTTFPAEAESLRAKAEALMWRHRLDAAQLREAGNAPLDPTWRTWPVSAYNSPYTSIYWSLTSAVIVHFDCRGVRRLNGSVYDVDVCGYDGELRMAETTYTEFRLAFQRLMEPRVDPDKSDQENAYALRSAGLEGRVIAEMLYGQNTSALRSKVRNMYKREAEARGEDPSVIMGTGSVKDFRRSYAAGFEERVWSRLAQMRRSRGDASQELVLASSKERVDEAFYERYPKLRPSKPAGSLSNDGPSQQQADCLRCKRAKSGYCKEHRWLRPTKVKSQRINWGAFDRGGAAASSVDLGAPQGRRLDQ